MLLPRHLIFDLDGTLLDSAEGIRQSLAHAIAEVAPNLALPAIAIGPPIREMLTAAFPGVDHATVAELVHIYRSHYDSAGWKHCQLYPGVIETLEALRHRGHNLLLATNKPAKITQQLLTYFSLGAFFSAVGSVEPESPAMADKALLTRKLLNESKLISSECCLIGDAPSDAHAANANHLDFIWASYGYGTGQEIARYGKPCRELRALSQLLELDVPLSAAA